MPCAGVCAAARGTLTAQAQGSADNSHFRASKTKDESANVADTLCPVQAYASLPDGSYTLTVQAQDGAGNTNGTPVTRSWTVTAPQGSYAQITVYQRVKFPSSAVAMCSALKPASAKAAAQRYRAVGYPAED